MKKQLTITQYDIAKTLTGQFDYISLTDAITHIQNVFGSTATKADTIAAYETLSF